MLLSRVNINSLCVMKLTSPMHSMHYIAMPMIIWNNVPLIAGVTVDGESIFTSYKIRQFQCQRGDPWFWWLFVPLSLLSFCTRIHKTPYLRKQHTLVQWVVCFPVLPVLFSVWWMSICLLLTDVAVHNYTLYTMSSVAEHCAWNSTFNNKHYDNSLLHDFRLLFQQR